MEIEQLKHVGTKQERSCEFKVVPLSVCLLSITTELASILSRKNKCEYKVLIDLSCVAVVQNKSNT